MYSINEKIPSILKNFKINLRNYEIVNMEEKKGWSAAYLFLIVEDATHYILKGKKSDQLAGYMNDIYISKYLYKKGFQARLPLKTLTNEYHHVEEEIYWELKTYIPGSVDQYSNYDNFTVLSLAKLNLKYIKSSLNKTDLPNSLPKLNFWDIEDMLYDFTQKSKVLEKVLKKQAMQHFDWLVFAKQEAQSILEKDSSVSIIHNDLNFKNILLDLSKMKAISFIDWDHGCISSPLKDILDPINMFYDFVPNRYIQMKKIYFKEIKDNFSLKITNSEINFLQVYFYALSKWKYILFVASLIENLGNSTNEEEEFERRIKFQLNKLKNLGSIYKVF